MKIPSAKKKTTTKGTVAVKIHKKKKQPVIAEGMHCFWVSHGPVLSDLRDLAHAFDTISDEQFFHHVTDERNDFSLWVMEVLRDEPTARELARAKSRATAKKVARKALSVYEW